MNQRIRRRGLRLLGVLLLGMVAYGGWIYFAIRTQAGRDEARPADCIIVLGAAQYNGRPSPVLKARLDHVLELFKRGLAPRILTTGGPGRDKKYSEAGVSKDYLVKHGIPAEVIDVDPVGGTTYESVQSIKQRFGPGKIGSCIVVSDGFHLFRSRALFAHEGIVVYPSPAPDSPIESSTGDRIWYTLREVFVYTAFKLGLHV